RGGRRGRRFGEDRAAAPESSPAPAGGAAGRPPSSSGVGRQGAGGTRHPGALTPDPGGLPMAGNPEGLELLQEMLASGKTPEEVWRDRPELLPEVRRRWQEFCLIDAQVRTLLPGLETHPCADGIPSVPHPAGLPRVPGYEVEAVLGRGGMGVV